VYGRCDDISPLKQQKSLVTLEEEENLFRQTNNIIRDNNVQQYGRLPEEA